MSDSYQARFIEDEDERIFEALDAADRARDDLRKMGPLGQYLSETRMAYIAATRVLEDCEPDDLDTITKAQADCRAYRRVREYLAGIMLEGDRAYQEHENPAEDDFHAEAEQDMIEIPGD